MITYLLLGMSGLLIALPDAGVVEKTDPVIATAGNTFAFLQIIFYLICLVAVLFLASRATRWLGGKVGGVRGRYMRVIETLYLGPNRSLYLITVCNRLLLISTAERNINLVMEINDPAVLSKIMEENTLSADSNGKGQTPKSFSDYMKKLLDASKVDGTTGIDRAGADSSSHRIEERLMKFRTHRGQNGHE